MLKRFLARRRLRQIRHLTRAFLALMRDGDAAADHMDRARRLALVRLPVPAWCGLGILPRDQAGRVEAMARQKIFASILYKHLFPELLTGSRDRSRPLVLPIPPAWRRWLEGEGFAIATWRCRLGWWREQLRSLAGAYYQTFRLALNLDRRPDAPESGYAALLNAPRNALPVRPGDYGEAKGLVRWYRDGDLRLPNEDFIWLECPSRRGQWQTDGIEIVSHALPRLRTPGQRARFLASALYVLTMGTLASAMGAWWAPKLTGEAVMLAYFKCLDDRSVASSYVFNNSSWIFRPLWTYAAEERGGRVIMLFYSSNMQPMPWTNGRISPVFPGYEIMTWPEYAVWNEEQRDFLIGLGHGGAAYHICGSVDLEDAGDPVPALPRDAILVFDVSIFRPSRLAQMGLVPPYYSAATARRFLEDLQTAADLAEVSLVVKSKRNVPHMMDRDYRNLMAAASQRPNVQIAAPTISIGRLPATVLGSVSAPFTSAALATDRRGIPSVYYDPTGQTPALRSAQSRTIDILTDVEQLTAWMIGLKQNSRAAGCNAGADAGAGTAECRIQGAGRGQR